MTQSRDKTVELRYLKTPKLKAHFSFEVFVKSQKSFEVVAIVILFDFECRPTSLETPVLGDVREGLIQVSFAR